MTQVRRVASRRDLETFVRLPWALYRGDANWVPPLLSAERKMLDPERNPFWRRAEGAHFLAERDGRVVGRVSAVINRPHNERHNEKSGWFGFFEAADADAGDALLDAAESWCGERGMTRVLGPANPSMNDPSGLLIEGFDRAPYVMMTYNPASYVGMIESRGYSKAMDLLAYVLHKPELARQRLDRVVRLIGERSNIVLRRARFDRFDEELRTVMEIYNDAWSDNWGFVPWTEDEMHFVGDDMRSIALPEFVLMAEYRGKTIGFALALPDINESLRKANGRLFPFGWFHFLKWRLRRIPRCRVLALGVRREFQHLGVGPLFYQRLIDEGMRLGYQECEMSWILEENEQMTRPLHLVGAKPYKRYRIYAKPLMR